jgi:hypothetical protein
MNSSDFYVKEIFKKFGYIANWLPNSPIKVGDVGIMEGYYFKRQGSLKELNLNFETREEQISVNFSYSLKADITIESDGSAKIYDKAATAALKIGFNAAGSFVFETTGCKITEIENKISLGKEIKKRFKDGAWDSKWVVIDSIVSADVSTIIVSNSENSELRLSASADVSKVNLTDASMNLKIKSQSGEITKFIADKTLFPLFNTSKIKQSFLDRLTRNKDNARFGGQVEERTSQGYTDTDIWDKVTL